MNSRKGQAHGATTQNDTGFIAGYASVFNVTDSQGEAVQAGAFARAIKNAQQRGVLPAMLWMHDPEQPIGVWHKLYEDRKGLWVEGQLALRGQKAAELYELLKMGAVSGLSIGYRVQGARLDRINKRKLLTDIELVEVSLVTFPANNAARVQAVKQKTDGARAIIGQLRNAARILQTP